MQPWKISAGLTAAIAGSAILLAGPRLEYLAPYWPLLLAEHGVLLALHLALALATVAGAIYAVARAAGLAVGWLSRRSGQTRPPTVGTLGRQNRHTRILTSPPYAVSTRESEGIFQEVQPRPRAGPGAASGGLSCSRSASLCQPCETR